MTDELAAAIGRIRRDATNKVPVVSCRADLVLVCDACEQQAQEIARLKYNAALRKAEHWMAARLAEER